jgi:hemerythrin-like metal-binding protein
VLRERCLAQSKILGSGLVMILSEDYTPLGFPPIDEDHVGVWSGMRELLTAAASSSRSLDELARDGRKLIDQIARHFAFEERLMRQIGFGGTKQHAEVHQQLLNASQRHIDSAKNAEDIIEWLSRTARWFYSHHTSEDILLAFAMSRSELS